MNYELYLTAAAFFLNVYFLLKNMGANDKDEISLYFIAHVIVVLCFVFFYFAESKKPEEAPHFDETGIVIFRQSNLS